MDFPACTIVKLPRDSAFYCGTESLKRKDMMEIRGIKVTLTYSVQLSAPLIEAKIKR